MSSGLAFDELTAGSVDLIRLEANLYGEVEGALRALMRDVRVALNKGDLGAARMATRLRAADGVRAEVVGLIDEAYSGIWHGLSESLRGAAGVGRDQALEALAKEVGAKGLVAPSNARVLGMLDRIKYRGATFQDWMAGQSKALIDRFETSFGRSLASGDDLATTMSQVLGSPEMRFRDGVFGASLREGRALVRSSVQGMANAGRNATWRSNEGKIKYLEWVSILDGRTTPMCLARVGRLYTVTGSPVGHTLSWGGGPGFLHWGCRSYSVPVFDDSPGDTPDYESWLAEQPDDFQNEALGPRRAQLFRDGKVGFEDLVNFHGTRPLSLNQIRKKIGE